MRDRTEKSRQTLQRAAQAPWLTRREALGLLGAAAGFGLGTAVHGGQGLAAVSQTQFTSAEPPVFPAGAIIRTLRGDVAPETLANGATLFHEHLRGGVDLITEEVRAAGNDGVTCLVDSATGNRSAATVDALNAVAARTDVHIVMAGGYFEDVGFALYPVRVAEMSEDELFDELVQNATAQRWGALGEIATSLEMRPDERKVLRAISRAHARTNLPIFTHTPHESCPSCALEQMDVIESAGVDLRRVVIGHMSTIQPKHDPLGTHTAVARRGPFVGIDTVGHEMSRSEIPAAAKVRMVLDLIDAGYEDHILLSSDMGNPRHFKANWGNGFSTVLVQFAPKLRFAGVPDRMIRKILVDNPRRFLAFVPTS